MSTAVCAAMLVATFTFPSLQAGQSAIPVTPSTAEAEATAQTLLKAFTAGDVPGIAQHFADKVLFIGDPQFLGGPRGPHPRVELTREQLTEAYTKMLNAMGRDRWTTILKQAKPIIRRAVSDESHAEDTNGILPANFIKAGEHVLELKFPGSGIDDVVLFVLRAIDGKFKVVAHWADY